ASGEFLGRQLSIDSVAGGPARVSLPADSFAGPLVGSLMLFGGETEEGSQVSAIDVAAGCATTLIGSADVIRGATISRDGAALYFHSVTQRRRDLGVRRLDIASGGVEQVIGPIEADAAYGVTFATVLAWSEDGGSLAVQSCAIERCRTRVLDTATGELALYAGDGHGALVGLDAARLYVFDDCHTRPCALLAIERDGGATSVVADEAFHAEMASQAGLTRLLIETAAGVEEVTP
ncbi:MAG TPA: hypothetical protein VNW68_06405, partial [Candidatus Limnocylindria bacterium]|nr:hypothetical protein [Candidatus Limnocylindria bacterium]